MSGARAVGPDPRWRRRRSARPGPGPAVESAGCRAARAGGWSPRSRPRRPGIPARGRRGARHRARRGRRPGTRRSGGARPSDREAREGTEAGSHPMNDRGGPESCMARSGAGLRAMTGTGIGRLCRTCGWPRQLPACGQLPRAVSCRRAVSRRRSAPVSVAGRPARRSRRHRRDGDRSFRSWANAGFRARGRALPEAAWCRGAGGS